MTNVEATLMHLSEVCLPQSCHIVVCMFVSFSNGVEYSLWDRWEVHGNKDFTIKQFIHTLQVNDITGLLLNAISCPQLASLIGSAKQDAVAEGRLRPMVLPAGELDKT